jgi:hypothetical protein
VIDEEDDEHEHGVAAGAGSVSAALGARPRAEPEGAAALERGTDLRVPAVWRIATTRLTPPAAS